MAASPISSLILLLLVSTASTTKIESFDAKVEIGSLGEHSTAYANFIELWASVAGCHEDKCTCAVTVENHEGSHPVDFYTDKPKIGRAVVTELQPFTKYKFTLTCQGEKESEKVSLAKEISTDKGRPSAPQNFAANAETYPVKITWAPPKTSAGPIDLYQFWIEKNGNKVVSHNISASDNSHDIVDKSEAGNQHSIYLTACNLNLRNQLLCSNPNDASLRLTFPTSPTTTSTTPVTPVTPATDATTTATSSTTTPKSFAVSSSSISSSVMFVGLCFALFGFGR